MRSNKQTVKESGKKRARKPQLSEELSRVNLNTAGIDVGASSHFVAVPADRAYPQVREFAAYTADLYRLVDWLADCEIEAVVMESTGVYWIPLFEVLEDRGLAVMLVDPRRIKNVPGRKTDVLDCQWLQQLHTYGLLSAAFRPEGEVRRLRSYLRQRAMLVRYASHHIQHMQKALSQMNVKLQHVISDVTGKTGLAIIDDIVRGERDAHKLAQHRDPKIRADQEAIPRSLQGHSSNLPRHRSFTVFIKARSPSATGRSKLPWNSSDMSLRGRLPTRLAELRSRRMPQPLTSVLICTGLLGWTSPGSTEWTLTLRSR